MIFICDICKRYECPPSCPNFDGYVSGIGLRRGECAICGQGIYQDDVCYTKNRKMLCADCAEELISPELLDFLDCDNIKDFFDILY